MNPSRLLFPALRFDGAADADRLRADGVAAIELGVGGFIVFGGEAEQVRALIADLRRAADYPLLFGADLERGAGQQFEGATRLPPAAALAHLADLDALRFAGAVTGREANALGIDWVFAPVADVDLEADNPIIGTRAFGGAPRLVSERVSAWITGCRAVGVMSCAKHFPGHGRTITDSHVGTPVVSVPAAELEADLGPFRAAIAAGVDSIMTAHVRYPTLDRGGRPATLSERIVTKLLRGRLGFGGLVVTDALIMSGVGSRTAAGQAAVEAIEAGVDVLLYPHDLTQAATALATAMSDGHLPAQRVRDALGRLDRAARARNDEAERGMGRVGAQEDRDVAISLAVRSLEWVGGTHGWPVTPTELEDHALSHPWARVLAYGESVLELISVDDDEGGPFPSPSRDPLVLALAREGVQVIRDLEHWEDGSGPEAPPRPPRVVALFAEPRGWKGRAGLSPASEARLTSAVEDARAVGRPVAVLLFGPPRLASRVPAGVPTLLCWGGESLMQEAVARKLVGSTGASPGGPA